MITIEDFYGFSGSKLAESVVLLMLRTEFLKGSFEKLSPDGLKLIEAIADLTPVQAASLAEQVSRLLKIRLEEGDAA